MEKIVVIVGANASGKSSLAVSLAQQYNGEVISADSRQVYRGLDIATGKMTTEEMAGIAHHAIDVADVDEMYTASDFARDARIALMSIIERGKLPIVAGGTGFYIDALLNPQLLADVPPNEALRKRLAQQTPEALFAQLVQLDPKRARDLKEKGEETLTRRLIRAIEVASAPVQRVKKDEKSANAFDVLWIGIHWDDDTLKERIHQRTLERIDAGMIDEATRLHQKGTSYERMEELGLEYKHLADYLRGHITKYALIENIDRDDWKYAKRQRTWFRRNNEIKWFAGGALGGVGEVVGEFLKKV